MIFNTEQQEAILHHEGPAMVLAGPGSGKTAVIVHRIQHLIQVCHVPPQNILVITFTRAAAREMQSRFLELDPREGSAVSFGTFHAVFYKILRYTRHLGRESVLTPELRYAWLKELMAREPETEMREQEFLTELSGEIMSLKAGGGKPENFEPLSCPKPLFLRAFRGYEEKRRSARKLDFEDMLTECRELLNAQPEILRRWQERYRYILVDEFQDINSLQYEVLKLLAAPSDNLFIVGDDDQSIYRFRGARPEIMLSFPQDYPDCRVIRLRDCYRLSPELLAAAGQLIGHNKTRYSKQLVSRGAAGPPPELKAFADSGAEREALALALQAEHAKGTPWGKMAVLTRTNFLAGGLIPALSVKNIPFASREKLTPLYDTAVAEDVFAYLALAAGSRSRRHFLRIANRPLRYLPRAAFPREEVSRSELLDFCAGKRALQEAVEILFDDLEHLSGLKPFAAVEYLRRQMGYELYLKDRARERDRDPAPELELLDALQEESAAYERFDVWEKAAEKVRLETKLSRERTESAGEDAVLLTTMHGAKGLEFDCVFLPGISDENLPHRRCRENAELEEERRLFYVAVTRARRRLWISWGLKTRSGRAEPSRFLKELADERILREISQKNGRF